MKKKYLFLLVVGLFIAIFMYQSFSKINPVANDNSPDWIPLHEAAALAEESGKLIFIDVFEIGCVYCRAMDREVFPDSTVRQVLDSGYIPVRIDGNSSEMVSFNNEEMSAQAFAQSKGAYVFPTSLIMDKEGNIIKKAVGYMGVDQFRQFLYQ